MQSDFLLWNRPFGEFLNLHSRRSSTLSVK
jgi:hypothetical protein